MKKIVVRIKGGLGNQLFCYAAARRLALANKAELLIDNVTGFVWDHQFNRPYALSSFNIPCRNATPAERLEPFGRYRRRLLKWLSRRRPFMERKYLEQEGVGYDKRLLAFKVNGDMFMEGLWQSEQYFKDIEQTIRSELRIIPPKDEINQRMADEISSDIAVALHVRWFNPPGSSASHNLSVDYYQRAIAMMEEQVASPHYFLFSDDPDSARSLLNLSGRKVTIVSHNRGDDNAYADLWLMSQCQHFITANSTFSWWGAWLATNKDKIVLTPNFKVDGLTAWGFDGLIPDDWIKL